jgi:hypothetical protein
VSLTELATLVGAVASAIVSVIACIAAFRRSKRSTRAAADADCHERLTKAWAESERVASELHDLRMRGVE